MSTDMETAPPRTTAPPRPTIREPGPSAGRPAETRRLWRWIGVAVVLAGIAIGLAVSTTLTSDPVEDTYVLDGSRLVPGLADGWFRSPDGPVTAPVAATAGTPVRQGYTPGLPDGWYDPAAADGGATDATTPTYPVRLVR